MPQNIGLVWLVKLEKFWLESCLGYQLIESLNNKHITIHKSGPGDESIIIPSVATLKSRQKVLPADMKVVLKFCLIIFTFGLVFIQFKVQSGNRSFLQSMSQFRLKPKRKYSSLNKQACESQICHYYTECQDLGSLEALGWANTRTSFPSSQTLSHVGGVSPASTSKILSGILLQACTEEEFGVDSFLFGFAAGFNTEKSQQVSACSGNDEYN